MSEHTDKILDGTTLSPAVKFQTINQTFDNLKAGEGFILINDHDPKPLYYHLNGEHGDIFTWEYLEKGPDLFKIRIAKKPVETSEEEEDTDEYVLDGVSLDPAVKFQTIMKTFNDLKEGETFILHNDHDPKPLYYKLSGSEGDTFIWEYITQGPDFFNIRIGKKVISDQSEGGQSSLSGQTSLSRTSSEAEMGVEMPSAPDFHDGILFPADAPETVRTIVAKDFRKTKVFRKHDLDFAWQADKSLTEVCNAAGISETDLRKELTDAELDFSEVVPSKDYYHWGMAFLTNYILKTHHQYVKDNAERIIAVAEEVGKTHGADKPHLKELGENVGPMIKDFIVHMSKEEDVLFPAINHMLDLLRKGEKQAGPGGDIARGIRKMEEEHDETRVFLQRFRKITNGYQLDADACEAQKLLYKDLQLFENDCWLHVHLENNILFPKTIILEQMISN